MSILYVRDLESGEFIPINSLRGERGIQGPQGEKGQDGQDGAPGPNEVSTGTDSNIAGLLKGLNGKVAQAIAGTDYLEPDVLPDIAPADKGKVLVVNDQGELDKGSNGLIMEEQSSGYKVYQDGSDVTDNLPYVSKNSVGEANGIAELDAAGKVPGNQLNITYSDVDIGAGAPLANGELYFVYE